MHPRGWIRRAWGWVKDNSGGIQAILAVLGSVAIILSFVAYRQTHRSLDLQEAALVEARNAITTNRDQIREQQKKFTVLQQESSSDAKTAEDRYVDSQKSTQRSLALTAGELQIAENSLRQSRELFHDQERPWVSIIDGAFLPAEIGSPVISLNIRADNNGHSPATNLHVASVYLVVKESEWQSVVPGMLLKLSHQKVAYGEADIGPGGTRGIILPIADRFESLQAINSGAMRLVVVGRIEYNDRLSHEEPHRTQFCFVFPNDSDDKRFGLCPAGNSQE